MAEVLLSASLQVLFERIASREFISFFSKRKIDVGLVNKMKITFLALKAVLSDAENKQITNSDVKAWLDELQHAVYRADDLLDEIATKALKAKLEAESHNNINQVGFNRFIHLMKKFLARINCFVCTSIYLSDQEMECRIKEVITNLEDFVKQKDILGLREGTVGREQSERPPTTCLVDESDVCGRNNDTDKIVDMLLLSHQFTTNQISVIPIVGMGGVGKTTLAQLAYNHVRVNQNFDIKAWVCVSDDFDVFMITKKIVEAVTGSTNDITDLNLLQIKLKDSLSGKKFLIVLDDVWNEDYLRWEDLKKPFRSGDPKSRIIVTSRNENVAKVMRSVPSHHLEQLSFEDSWSLFAKHAFSNGDLSAHPDLEMIGKKIVNKCQGLPLAVKSLGGLLRSERDIEEWKNIFKSEMWDPRNNILPALRLSYHYLPSHLKRCFAYCSIFLKDHKFKMEELVQLWMAEGIVQQPKSDKSMEDEGNNCFSELLSRSFFQRLSGTSAFVMHDLVHDLAEFISGEFCCKLRDDHHKPGDLSEKVRHFSYVQARYDTLEKFNGVNKAKYLRTFISFSQYDGKFLSKKVLHDMLPSMTCLRVLSLRNYQIFELPKTIDKLIHLRSLDLSWTKLKRLPDSILTLCNLQTLNLSSCRSLIELPMDIGKLVNLRHLNVSDTQLKELPVDIGKLVNLRHLDVSFNELKELPVDLGKLINLHYLYFWGTTLTEMPVQMSRLVGLQRLTKFVVGKDSGSRINELRTLDLLHGKLSILELQNVINSRDALEANLKDKKQLEELELEWGGNGTRDSQNESDVLHNLKPHTNLKCVTIKGFGGRRLPDWLGDVSFRNIVRVSLSKCKYCNSLPPLGQLSALKHLSISGMKEVRNLGEELYGDASLIKPFQSLETLSFQNMPGLEEWHALGAGEFSCLVELSLIGCPNLTGELPNHFPCLRTLIISGCQRLESHHVGLLLQHLSSLHELEISKMRNLTQLPLELKELHSLKKLIISKMRNLKELPPELWRLINLERLEIKECSSLVSFPDFALPRMLKKLTIHNCDAVESLPEEMMRFNTCLEELSISCCSSLVSFPIGGTVRDTLKSFSISNCEKLVLPIMSEEEMEPCSTSIEELSITRLSLKSLSLRSFPKLRSLEISDLKDFETLSIPDGLQSLTQIEIFDCHKLKSLPQRMHTHLPSLESLYISSCPEVESFPDGGLPANIRLLHIHNCQKLMKRRMEWGLQTLPSLEELTIGMSNEDEEDVLEPFPEEWLLPTTLTSLDIIRHPNLKSLNQKGLQHLTSLKSLGIWYCPMLQSLPEEGLPNSLSFLRISNCPLLTERYQAQKGKDWSTIAQIRHIQLDDEVIVNLE